MKTKIEKQMIFYFICIASSLAGSDNNTTQSSETTERSITVEFEKNQDPKPDSVYVTQTPHAAKDNKKLIFFLKKEFQNFKLTDENLTFNGMLTFSSTVETKKSNFFKPKSEIPHQFQIIAVELTDDSYTQFNTQKNNFSPESFRKIIKENEKSVIRLTLTGSPSDDTEDKNTRVELEYKTGDQRDDQDGGTDNQSNHMYRLTLVETKYSEKELSDSYDLDGLEIIQGIGNPSNTFSHPFSQIESKLILGKIQLDVNSITVDLKTKKGTQTTNAAFINYGTVEEADSIWKILEEVAPNKQEKPWSTWATVSFWFLVAALVVGLIVGIYYLLA